MRNVFGPAFIRQSNQPMLRNYPQADNQIFRISRGEKVRATGGSQWTYRPLPDYWRAATCEEANCEHYLKGWVTKIPLDPNQDPEQLHFRQAQSGYIHNNITKWSVSITWEGTTEVFTFTPGQMCFRAHQVPVERDPMFIYINGRRQPRQVEYNELTDRYNETAHLLNRRHQDG